MHDAEGRLPLISVHSHKGGVGKTTVCCLLGAALAEDVRVCVVDLDLVAPGVHCAVGVRRAAIAPRGGRRRRDSILDYLMLHPDDAEGPPEPSAIIREVRVGGEPPNGRPLWIVPGRPQFDQARGLQSYLMAEVRTGLVSARLEHMLHSLRESHRIDLFILDTPPSLFGMSAGARRLVEGNAGAQVFVMGPTVQDLIGMAEMLTSFEKAVTDGNATCCRALLLNAYPLSADEGSPTRTIVGQLLLASGARSTRAETKLWDDRLRCYRTAVLPEDRRLREQMLPRPGADAMIPWRDLVRNDVRDLAVSLLDAVRGGDGR